MTEATEQPKKTTPRPHPMAFRRETACARCGTDWFRPGVLFERDATELQHVTMCATCGATAPKYDTVTAVPPPESSPLSETRLEEPPTPASGEMPANLVKRIEQARACVDAWLEKPEWAPPGDVTLVYLADENARLTSELSEARARAEQGEQDKQDAERWRWYIRHTVCVNGNGAGVISLSGRWFVLDNKSGRHGPYLSFQDAFDAYREVFSVASLPTPDTGRMTDE